MVLPYEEIAAKLNTILETSQSAAPSPKADATPMSPIRPRDHERETGGSVQHEAGTSAPSAQIQRDNLLPARDRDTLARAPGRTFLGDTSNLDTPASHLRTFDELRAQIARMADQYEQSRLSHAKLDEIERSIEELFASQADTRASLEASTTPSNREILRVALEEGRNQNEQAFATSLAIIEAKQHEADVRTTSQFSAFESMLEKVVDYLMVMDDEIAEVRGHRDPPAGERTRRQEDPPSARAPMANRKPNGTPPIPLKMPTAHGPSAGRREADARELAGAAAAARAALDVSPGWKAEINAPAQTKAAPRGHETMAPQHQNYASPSYGKHVLLGMGALSAVALSTTMIKPTILNGAEAKIALGPTAAIVKPVPPKPENRPDPSQSSQSPAAPAAGSPGRSARATLSPAALRSMAEAGDGMAAYELGVHYAQGTAVERDFTMAALYFLKAAEQNIAPAQYRLASLYELGLGVSKDTNVAQTLYLKAAEAGNPRAMHNLGVLLAGGNGQPRYADAAFWFRKAAENGVENSQYNLAVLLSKGLGVPQSNKESYKWFAIAAASGDVDAAKSRDDMGARLSGGDLAAAKAMAADFRPRTPPEAATQIVAAR
jgi:localization factor PodJL